MSKLDFVVDYGMLQIRDLNPAAGGPTTSGLTNPQLEANEQATKEIITGNHAFTYSPLLFVIVILVVLFGVSYLQK